MARRTKPVQQDDSSPEAGRQHKTQNSDSKFKYPQWLIVGSIIGAALVCVIIYLLRYDRVAGFTVDDAWYILLAKALATGRGYTLINSPSPGIMPFYPPGFPFLLSLVFRISPNFPQNVWLLKAVSIIAMFGAGIASYWYFAHYRMVNQVLAGAMAVVIVLNPILVFFATSSVMSEPVFALAQILAVIVIERCVREGTGNRALVFAVIGAALSSYVFLTRSMGVSLLVGIVLYLAKEKLWRSAIAFVIGCALLLGPWMIYSRQHVLTPQQRAEQGGYITYPYSEQFWMKTAGNPYAGNVTAGEIPTRVFENLWQMVGRESGRIFATPIYRSSKISGFEFQGYKGSAGIISVILSLLIMLGFIATVRQRLTLAEIVFPMSIGVIALWPWYPLRFLIPYLPFVLYYLVRGCQFLQQLSQKLKEAPAAQFRPAAALAVIGCIIALYGFDHAAYILAKREPAPEEQPVWLAKFAESEEALKWMNENLPHDGSVAVSANPALIYLHTGMKTVSGGNIVQSWEQWKAMNVRYLAFVGYPSPMPPPGPSEKAFQQLYPGANASASKRPFSSRLSGEEAQFEGNWNNRIVDLGPPQTRPDWGKRNNAASGGEAGKK